LSSQRTPTIFDSFNYAFEGLIHVLRTQRNMRVHFLAAVLVLVIALVVNVSKIELIVLLISIVFVLVAEMVNTAIEGAIDVATSSFDPMAKLAKDIAAGACCSRRSTPSPLAISSSRGRSRADPRACSTASATRPLS
jgi:diacylglycerol kinase